MTFRSIGIDSRLRASALVDERSRFRNTRRTGAPVRDAFLNFDGKYATATAAALRACNRVAKPGWRSYETVTTGMFNFFAARVAGTLAYPPTDTTTAGRKLDKIRSAFRVAFRKIFMVRMFRFKA